jgi:hypothetical protein
LYAYGFRFYFTPLSAVLFAFPSRYWFTIGQSGVFSLGRWSSHVQTGFLVPRPTHLSSIKRFRIRDYHPLWLAFPGHFATSISTFGLLPVRSSLLGESRLISFPPGTEIFQFPGFASSSYVFTSPFRHLRINACCQLPGAFRRLPRLSSPLTAKASTVCAYSLDHITLSRLKVIRCEYNDYFKFRHSYVPALASRHV